MQLTGNRQEWAKAYALLQILSNGNIQVHKKTPEIEYFPVLVLVREDESKKVTYRLTPENIVVRYGDTENEVPREECRIIAAEIFKTFENLSARDYSIPSSEHILNKLQYTWFHNTAEDKSDFTITYFDPERETAQRQAVIVRSASEWSLLPANRAANLKYDIQNIRFSNPETNRINRIDGEHEVRKRLIEIDRLGGKLKYTTPENKFFLENLCMIDLHFPRLLAELTRLFYTTELSAIRELTEEIKSINPYKIKEELIQKNNFYEYKVQQFLYALATGMRSTKRYRGYGSTLPFAIIGKKGEITLLDPVERPLFDQFLYQNAHMTIADCNTHKFGFIEKENGQWFIKLNIEISL